MGEWLGLTKEEEEGENQGAEILLAESPVPPQRHWTTSVAKQDDDDNYTLDLQAWIHVSFAL